MNVESLIIDDIKEAFYELFHADLEDALLQPTRKEFEGTYTFVVFPYLRVSKKKPEETGELIGQYLKEKSEYVTNFNVVKGFLNLVVSDSSWVKQFNNQKQESSFDFQPFKGHEMMVEYSSPNTNKPLHLGHLRNNFLGNSVSKIYSAVGYNVIKAQIINDRGIHICKSMLAWLRYGNGETPESSGLKGDKLVGKYYVEFDRYYKAEIGELMEGGMDREEAEKKAPILMEAQEMLRKWEQRDPAIYKLWQTMNGWVYDGFDNTYEMMGVSFDRLYYESDTYLLGKDKVLEGVEKGVFYQKEDGSVWVDLTEDGLDNKLLLRADGTSVYMTQDIGTAIMRFEEFPKLEKQVYTVGNEQDYHFKVLFIILKKLGYKWADECYHLSYGMVDLPSGKMKSREGTVVDADDLILEMEETAKKHTEELGKIDGFTEEEAENLYHVIGLGALKYFLLKVDPKKRILFDPQESIQFQGNTGPFIQYTHARIRAIIRKADELNISPEKNHEFKIDILTSQEKDVIYQLTLYKDKILEAAKDYAPSVICNYIYDLAKTYNSFYQEVSIFNEEDTEKRDFRISLSEVTARTIKHGMRLLGIEVPEQM